MNHSLVIATSNRGKLKEFRELLSGLPLEILSICDVIRTPFSVDEDGETFSANAIKKARAVADATMMLTLADDSGLEVDALEGAPGVRSARFAHERATDAENNAALLRALDAVDVANERIADNARGGRRGREARFRCVLALFDPYARTEQPILTEGVCEGTIARVAQGAGGFGYDPLFIVTEFGKTMAELSESEKNEVSHRARACALLRPHLQKILTMRDETIDRISLG